MSPSPAVVDLLGALAYGELSAFEHLAEDAGLAPTLTARAEMSRMAATEFGHYTQIAGRLAELGADPEHAMAPFVAAVESYHALTAPSTWLESVVKAYVGDGMAADFYREVAAFVAEPVAELITAVSGDADRAEFAVREVRAAIEADPAVRGRLTLWARRLVGEALSQAQHVLADRDALTELLITGSARRPSGPDDAGAESSGGLNGVSELLARVTGRHAERMSALGLDQPDG